jgi:MoaA/NifB/PqqE/SkfB family radical SAM enzyme
MISRRNLTRLFRKALADPAYAWRAFRQRFRSYLSYMRSDGRSAPPETISLFLTFRCNLRCKMCGQWGPAGSARGYSPETLRQELSRDEIHRLLDEVRSFRPNITLFGGEPMLHNDFAGIIADVKAAGLRCNVITNATLLERFADTLAEQQLDEIIFSLDGPREVHDEVRGVPGTFDRAMAGFEKLRAAKARTGNARPRVNVTSVVFETSYERLPELIPVAEELGADTLTVHHLIFYDRATYHRHNKLFEEQFGRTCYDWEGFVVDEVPAVDPEKVIAIRNDMLSARSAVPVAFYPNLTDDEVRRWYGGFEFEPTSYSGRCKSPWMVAYVFPDGGVRPFHSMNFVAGNIREASFGEIWNNDAYRRYRREVKRCGRFPICSRCTELYRF